MSTTGGTLLIPSNMHPPKRYIHELVEKEMFKQSSNCKEKY